MELAAGILIIIMSGVHIIYGEKNPVREMKKLTEDSILIGSVRVMSLQGGVLLFAVGLIHLLSFFHAITLSGAAAYFPVGIISMNLLTFLLVAAFRHRKLFSVIAFQLVVFAVIILLQIMVIQPF